MAKLLGIQPCNLCYLSTNYVKSKLFGAIGYNLKHTWRRQLIIESVVPFLGFYKTRDSAHRMKTRENTVKISTLAQDQHNKQNVNINATRGRRQISKCCIYVYSEKFTFHINQDRPERPFGVSPFFVVKSQDNVLLYESINLPSIYWTVGFECNRIQLCSHGQGFICFDHLDYYGLPTIQLLFL